MARYLSVPLLQIYDIQYFSIILFYSDVSMKSIEVSDINSVESTEFVKYFSKKVSLEPTTSHFERQR